MNYYPHHIADFDQATRHLTRVERSVYRDAIERYYDTECALTKDFDALAKRLLCVSDDEKQALKFVLDEFFIEEEGGFYHSRCEEEIAKYRTNTSAKAKAGRASAEARRQKAVAAKQKRTPVEQPLNSVERNSTNQEPITNNQCITPQQVLDIYNQVLGNTLPKAVELTTKRRKAANARITDNKKREDPGWWEKYFTCVREECPKLTGSMPPREPGGSIWKADLDFLLRPDTEVKIREKKYK